MSAADHACRRSALGREVGTSLVEVVIACVLLGILSTAVLTIVLQTQHAGVTNRSRIAASNLAAREIDTVRDEFHRSSTAPTTIAGLGTVVNAHPLKNGVVGQPLVVDGTSYTVTRSVQWNITGNGQSACDGGSLVIYPTLGVTVSVTWPNMGSVKPVVSTAALAPEKGSGIPSTDSFVAVRVKDSGGSPNVGRGVSVTGGGSTRTGTTDADGCAVVQVSPAAGTGTAYTATVTDAGYVDVSGTQGTSKAVGTLTRGQLNNSVTFQIDRAGTVNLRLVDENGAPLAASAATGSQMTLVSSESSGASSSRTVTATGPLTSVGGLWPTTYGAYFGSSAPGAGFATQKLAAGGTITLDVAFAAARLRVSGTPAGTTAVYAAPAGTTDCSASTVRQVDPAAVSLLPGTWSFFVTGSTFVCSPGPASVALVGGDNGEIVWGETTLRVTDAPAGTLWAVNRAKVTGSLLTCPSAAVAASAVNVDGARSGPLVIPAGDWYVYVTNGPAAGSCLGVPSGQYSKVLAYDQDNVIAWVTAPATVNVTGVSTRARYSVVAWTGADTMRCTNGLPAGTTTLSVSGSTYTGTFSAGTWKFFLRDTNAATCTLGGTVVVSASGATYTLPFSTTKPPTVK